MRQLTKNHHYIPKAILREFCSGSNSVHYLTRTDKKPQLRNISSIFRRRHYNTYTHADGTKDDTLERFFGAEFDNYIPEWREKFEAFIATGTLEFSADANRDRFAQFFYNHKMRSPDFLDPLVTEVANETFTDDLLKEIEAEFGKLTEKQQALLFDNKFRERVLSNTRVQNFSDQSVKILTLLSSMKIFIATPRNHKKHLS